VLYNKFDVSSSSPPDNPPRHPNSDYNCVVATTGQWIVTRCTEQHLVVCQSVHNTLSGKRSYYDQVFTLPISIPTLACVLMRIGLVFGKNTQNRSQHSANVRYSGKFVNFVRPMCLQLKSVNIKLK